MAFLSKIEKMLDFLCKAILFISTLGIVIIAFAQVMLRVLGIGGMGWADEICRYLQTLITFVGAGYLVGSNGHIAVDLLRMSVGDFFKKAIDVFSLALCIIFGVVITYNGFWLAMSQMSQSTSATGIPMGVIYAVLPLGGILMVLYAIIRLVFDFIKVDN